MAEPLTNGSSANEHRFQLLVESLGDYAIYMMDLEGRILTWNPGAERIKGYTREEIQGESFSRFFTTEDRANRVPERVLAEALREGRTENEGWRVRKDGTRFWALATVHSVRDETGELVGFAKITRDMTERRAAEQALLESERRFRYLVEGVVDYAIYMLDVNGTVVNWNRGAERLKLYGSDEIVGRHFSLFYTPEDRRSGLPAKALSTALKEGRYESEGWRLRKDGTRFWASAVIDLIHDEQGRHIGFAKITRDISDKRAAQDALALSERQFRMLVAGVVDYALFMLDPNGVVSNWNAGAQNIKGYTADEIVGQHFSVFYTEADRSAGKPMEALQTAIRDGRYEAEAWRVRKDGTLFFANVVIDAIKDEVGELMGFAKITRDITERRSAQLELQAAHERLAQAQKMEAIGQVTGGVAHDFNNLLMVVSGHAQLLRKRVPLEDPKVVRALDAVETAARRGQELTRHLLTFARRQRLNPEAVALHDRAAGIRELLSTSVGSAVRVAVDLPEDLWPVEADPGELDLALLNMAVNARDAMPGGGRLSISARNVRLKGGEVAPEVRGDFVAVTVEDSGSGIAPDILARVFEPFFTTKDVDKGTGLGLSQVYGFVEQSGGRAVIRSELGRGTTVILYLPRSRRQAATASGDQAEPEARSGVCVLVVEDNPEVAEVTVGLLEQLGNRTRLATSAEAALGALAEGEPPDLVLSDIVMAGEMNGLDLARRLREERPELPVLLATGYSETAENIGREFPILAKPFALHDLSRALGAAFATAGPRERTLLPFEPPPGRRRPRKDDA
ncbi:MAG TPA: PAS domain S-box protein [Caulobacteraceae bacterium]|jgi:PAS domain S-box-containing protein